VARESLRVRLAFGADTTEVMATQHQTLALVDLRLVHRSLNHPCAVPLPSKEAGFLIRLRN